MRKNYQRQCRLIILKLNHKENKVVEKRCRPNCMVNAFNRCVLGSIIM